MVFDSREVGYGMEDVVEDLGLPPRQELASPARAARSLHRALRYRGFKRDKGIELTYSFGDTANIVSVLSGGKDRKIASLRGFARLRLGDRGAKPALLRSILRFVIHHTDRVVTVSDHMREALLREYGTSPAKVISIRNGYDLESIVRDGRDGTLPEAVRGKKYLVSIGTLRQVKRFDHLIRAFAASRACEDLDLVIAGNDPYGMEPQLRSLASDLGVEGRVTILPFLENPFAVMANASAFVLTSESEGFPNVLLEAMALGVPVVSTDCPSGPREILAPDSDLSVRTTEIEHTRFGILVPPPARPSNFSSTHPDHSERELARALDIVCQTSPTTLDLAERGQRRAQDFDDEAWTELHKAMFDSLL